MPIESSPQFISDLNALWPLDADPRLQGAQQIRTVKTVLLKTFPAVAGAISASHTQINAVMAMFADDGTLTVSKTLIVPAVSDWTTYQAIGAKDGDARYIQGSSKLVSGSLDTAGNVTFTDVTGTVHTLQASGNYALNSSLNAEVARALQAEAALTGQITNATSAVGAESQRAQAAEQGLQTTLSASIASEAARAKAAEDALNARADSAQAAFPLPTGWVIQAFQVSTTDGATVTFPTEFSSPPILALSAQRSTGRCVVASWDQVTGQNFVIGLQREDTNGASQQTSPWSVDVIAMGPK